MRAIIVGAIFVASAVAAPLGHRAPQSATPNPPAADLQRLVEQVRGGDAQQAIAQFASWDPARVAAASGSVTNPDVATAATLVALYTGAAIKHGSFGGAREAPAAGDPFLPAATRLVTALTARASTNAAIKSFCSNWYVLTASLWCAGRHHATAGALLRPVRRVLGDEADVALAVGTASERLMGPFPSLIEAMLSQGISRLIEQDTKRTSQGILAPEYADAETWLSRAVSLNPGLIEARVRLARVLDCLDRRADAERELNAVLNAPTGASHPFAVCMAALFRGRMRERAGRTDDAAADYARAGSACPADQAPKLALAHLFVVSGRLAEGWTAARSTLAVRGSAEPAAKASLVVMYDGGQYWQAERRFADMLAAVKQ